MPDIVALSIRGGTAPGAATPSGVAVVGRWGDPTREPARFLEGAFAALPDPWFRRMPGRETFGLGQDLVVKRFRGDSWREGWHEWTRAGRRRSPARREFENLAALRELGLEVPAPLAWAEEAAACAPPFGAEESGGRSALVMERLAHDEHLRARLARSAPGESRAWREPLAEMVARLHGGGWFHRDLYLQHCIVLDPARRRLGLLDCGRARKSLSVPRRWIVKDLAQLLHSTPSAVGARARLSWFVAYARRRGLPRGPGRRELLLAVAAKARRLAAHAPRHVDPRTAGAEDPPS